MGTFRRLIFAVGVETVDGFEQWDSASGNVLAQSSGHSASHVVSQQVSSSYCLVL